MPGKVREGASLTGSNGISAIPTIARQTNATMMVKDDILFFLDNVKLFVLLFIPHQVPVGCLRDGGLVFEIV